MGEAVAVGTDQGTMAVRCYGDGDATVVLLHGIPGSSRIWDGVVPLLASGCRVVVPDLLGFGGSGRSTDLVVLHAAGQAAALAQVLDHLGVGRAVLVGHDFGGPVALTLARRRPELVSGLVLLATNALADTPIPFPLSAVTWPGWGRLAARILFSAPSLSLMLRRAVGSPRPPLDIESALGDRGQRRAIRLIFQASLTGLAELYGPVQDGLAGVAVPALVGWGDRDPFFSVDQGRRTAAAIPGARLRLYEDAGHLLPEERPREVASDVAELVVLAVAQ